MPAANRKPRLQGNAAQQVEALEWCPEEHRAEYFRLARLRQIRAIEAKRIMLDHIAAVERRKARMG